jgi:hypothetical protein
VHNAVPDDGDQLASYRRHGAKAEMRHEIAAASAAMVAEVGG